MLLSEDGIGMDIHITFKDFLCELSNEAKKLLVRVPIQTKFFSTVNSIESTY